MMFNKVLIANRGAIACRIIRTLKSMGVASVAIYSEADFESLHASEADEAVALPGVLPADTYLNISLIIDIAKRHDVEAIHPGYGFLSENAEFAEACESAGIVFIGPRASHMRQFGLKHAARELAEQAGVPLVPGSSLLQDEASAAKFASHIGFPVMLKSTAGGGGIGMQVCWDEAGLRDTFAQVKRLSKNNFGNDGVFLEKYIARARHIEIQVLGDGAGGVATLGERDCSLQRRNQKVIEETPAPDLPDDVREQMVLAAKRLTASVNYLSAGTVEYIYDAQTQAFYFLEMNTRLQVEHGVTELVANVDLVQSMLEIASGNFTSVARHYVMKGHAIQARVYAEDPAKNFQPSSGTLTHVEFDTALRNEHYIEAGITVSPFYDPMLAKVIAYKESRELAIQALFEGLQNTCIQGVVNNLDYLQTICESQPFQNAQYYTALLGSLEYRGVGMEILSAGTQTTVQDYPGRLGYWDVGIPPSGAMDYLSLQIGNQLLDNPFDAAALEMTLAGPSIKFRNDAVVVLTGAEMSATVDDIAVSFWQPLEIKAGSVLAVGQLKHAGMRSYLCVKGGIQLKTYLGSKSTFTLGQFGGYGGRALQVGDVVPIETHSLANQKNFTLLSDVPRFSNHWDIAVIYGPHGAPDFFTADDMHTFFATDWEVHFNSSRTGIRLIGPKPEWARDDGGEAGLHPSNIHDNAYAIGAVDFTGDMPVILGPDGPSLGGFVCPVTIVKADLWKMGQFKPGDTIRFLPIDYDQAVLYENHVTQQAQQLNFAHEFSLQPILLDKANPVLHCIEEKENRPKVIYRVSGDDNILIEYGPMELDLSLRFRVHALMLLMQSQAIDGVQELTPGIRSLQVRYDNHVLLRQNLLNFLVDAEDKLGDIDTMRVPTRTVYLPLSWDDASTKLAIEKYMTTVNPDAPWCPSNIEFIRRINGLASIEEIKRIVFDARYLVMGLGDVYLGAPVATPLDPRHRLVTTKYNPARTWTPENAVGIGGAYMCVYGMEGPGGYQFVGRTVQMWNRYRQTKNFTKPWLLRFFDQIKFYEVSEKELAEMRRAFPIGKFELKVEESEFSLQDYLQFLTENSESIDQFQIQQRNAFAEERARWQAMGLNFNDIQHDEVSEATVELAAKEKGVYASVPGSIWQLQVKEGDDVVRGNTIAIVESMKMEFPLVTDEQGCIRRILVKEGQQIQAGQLVAILE